MLGSIWPFHQMLNTPASAGDEAGQGERQRAVQRHVEAERRHPHRVVADPLAGQPERRAAQRPEPDVGDHREHEHDVVEPHRVPVEATPAGRCR